MKKIIYCIAAMLLCYGACAQSDSSYQLLWYKGKKIKPNVLLTPGGDTIRYHPQKGEIKLSYKKGATGVIATMQQELNKNSQRMNERIALLAAKTPAPAMPILSTQIKDVYDRLKEKYKPLLTSVLSLPKEGFEIPVTVKQKGAANEEDPWEAGYKKMRRFMEDHKDDALTNLPVPPRRDFNYCYECDSAKQKTFNHDMEWFKLELRRTEEPIMNLAFGGARQAEFLLKGDDYKKAVGECAALIDFVYHRQLKKVLALIDRSIKANASSVAARIALVKFHTRNKDPKAALAAAQAAAQAIPNDTRITDTLGLAQMAAGEVDKAIETYKRMAESQPDSPLPLMRLASAQYAAKQVDAPIQALRKALSLNPDLLDAHRDIVAVQVASGMAALAYTFLRFLPSGSHVVMTDDSYRRTRQLCEEHLKPFAVTCTVVPHGDYAALEAAIRPETRVLFSETPTNPFLRVLDLERFAAIGRRHGVLTVVDATFATPVNVTPLAWGIDLVIHSATKYLGGHNDLLAGFIAGRTGLIDALREYVGIMGGISDPNTAFLLLRGMKTLALRVAQQNRNGQTVAEFLAAHPAVEQVWYPGLESHPDHLIAAGQMKGYGGVVSLAVRGDRAATFRFLDALRQVRISPSLGGVESLVLHPAAMAYPDCTPAVRRQLGITDNLVRLALGIEDADNLIADLDQALQPRLHIN